MDVAPQTIRQPSVLPELEPRSPTPSTGPDICIVCLQPSAVVIREKRKGTHPPTGHVVGLTPEQCRQEFNSSLSWSIMQWQCAECSHVTWFSYYFYHDVYDGRWHGKHESPTQLARRAQEKGTLQGWPARQSQSQSASPEAPSRPKRPRVDTGATAPRFSNTPPQSTTSVTAAHPMATSSPFVMIPTQTAAAGPGEISSASDYSRPYEQLQSQSVSPAAVPVTRPLLPIPRLEGRNRSTAADRRRSSAQARRHSSRHERHLSNVQEEAREQSVNPRVPIEPLRRDYLDTRSPSVGSQLPQSAQPISPPRSATESRPLSAGVSDDFEPGDASERHHRRGSNFDLDNFNRIRRFGACEWCRKRKKRCSVSHHMR